MIQDGIYKAGNAKPVARGGSGGSNEPPPPPSEGQGPRLWEYSVGPGVIGYTVRPNFRSGGLYSLREYGPCKILYIQGIQSGGGGGLNSLTERRFDFDNHW